MAKVTVQGKCVKNGSKCAVNSGDISKIILKFDSPKLMTSKTDLVLITAEDANGNRISCNLFKLDNILNVRVNCDVNYLNTVYNTIVKGSVMTAQANEIYLPKIEKTVVKDKGKSDIYAVSEHCIKVNTDSEEDIRKFCLADALRVAKGESTIFDNLELKLLMGCSSDIIIDGDKINELQIIGVPDDLITTVINGNVGHLIIENNKNSSIKSCYVTNEYNEYKDMAK